MGHPIAWQPTGARDRRHRARVRRAYDRSQQAPARGRSREGPRGCGSALAGACAQREPSRAGSARSGPEEQSRQVRAVGGAAVLQLRAVPVRAVAQLRAHHLAHRRVRPVLGEQPGDTEPAGCSHRPQRTWGHRTVAEFLLETDALMRLRLVYKLFFIVYAAHIVALVELSIIISQLQAFQKPDWRCPRIDENDILIKRDVQVQPVREGFFRR